MEYESAQDIAAVIIEPFQGADYAFAPPGYLKALREWTKQRGIMLIFDETQTGMGRAGTMYRYQAEEAEPDLLVLGKALGNGLHIAAFLMKGGMDPGDIHAMNGGVGDQILACAAACSVYEELMSGGLLTHIQSAGAYFHQQLANLKERCPGIAHIRGAGLALAVECETAGTADAVMAGLSRQRILAGRSSTAVVLKPPYCLTQTQIDEVVNTIGSILHTLP